ncbi:rhomboid family intramembrane serine protease [candidate division KSB1 bacterium]|nr:rhomboid family intramembrane serine protease [candidate division KSB1 bacterium]
MIPIRDENPTRRLPVITIGLIAANVIAGIWSFTLPSSMYEALVYQFGTVPLLMTRAFNLLPQFPERWLSLVSSMFLHGGLMHLGGNMLYLWIFGNNVEDHLGHLKFLLFYLAAGVIAALAHYAGDITSTVPMIGASGAISGVLGAYLILYPQARVVTMVWFFFFLRFVPIPAYIVLGVWFLMQLTNLLGGGGGGVAWWAHIGGFIAGMLLIWSFAETRNRRRRLITF